MTELAIGFVGIGNMGWPMAANLVGAGFDVTVCDTGPDRAASFAADVGGRAATRAADAAADADVVITMLPTSSHVADVVRDITPSLATGQVVVDMSSGTPSVTRRLAEDLAPIGVALVDCPVSGGVPRAVTADLSIMAGGGAAVLDRVQPILDALGSSVHRCGGVGAGQAMKALNNLMSAAGLLIGVEALLIGQQSGLDPERMIEMLNASSGANNSTQRKLGPYVLTRAFDSGFGLDLMVKDLGIALQMGSDAGLTTPLATACAEVWANAAELLGRGHDHTEIARYSEAVSGVELAAREA